MIDARGRILGKVNVIDAAAAVAIAVAVAALAIAYQVSTRPSSPRVDGVEPPMLYAGSDLRVTLRGERFLPFFRVFVERSSDQATLSFRLQPREPSDEFTLSNRAQARLVVESSSLAEVWLPDGLLPGVYDLALYDETRQIAVARRAVAIAAPLLAPPPVSATVHVVGAFRGLSPDAVDWLRPGLGLPEQAPFVEIVAVEPPRPDSMRLQVGNTFVDGKVDGRVQVPAVLRVTCVPTDQRCRAGETYLAARSDLKVPAAGGTVQFFVEQIFPGASGTPVTADLDVRFAADPRVMALVKVGHVDDARIGTMGTRNWATTVTSIGSPRSALIRFQEGSRAVTESAVAFDVRLRAVVQVSDDDVYYRDQRIRAGDAFVFAHRTYVLHGTIARIDVRRQVEATRP